MNLPVVPGPAVPCADGGIPAGRVPSVERWAVEPVDDRAREQPTGSIG